MNHPIFRMAADGSSEMEALCQYSAEDLSQLSCLRSTPLHYAVLGGNKELITYLLEKGALVNARNVYAESPLHWACKMGDTSIVRLLVGTPKNDPFPQPGHLSLLED